MKPEPKTWRILLVDDHALFRQGVKTLLSTRPGFDVVAEASNGCEAIELAARHQPDVIFMDIDMPDVNGLDATRAIKHEWPAITIIMLTVSDYEAQLFEAIKSGASGYLLKNLEPQELFDMLEKLQRGEAVINGVLAHKILNELSRLAQPRQTARKVDQLSEREIEVLEHLVRGEENKEIAKALSITPNTVKTHLSNIMEKLHLRNRLEAAVYAVGEGLVDYRTDCRNANKDEPRP